MLEKVPNPLPIINLESEIVGFKFDEYTTPLSLTLAPPSEVTFPPNTADVVVIVAADAVVTTGAVLFETAGPTIILSIQKYKIAWKEI